MVWCCSYSLLCAVVYFVLIVPALIDQHWLLWLLVNAYLSVCNVLFSIDESTREIERYCCDCTSLAKLWKCLPYVSLLLAVYISKLNPWRSSFSPSCSHTPCKCLQPSPLIFHLEGLVWSHATNNVCANSRSWLNYFFQIEQLELQLLFPPCRSRRNIRSDPTLHKHPH